MNRELYLVGVTCTYNEAEMVPYVMPYVERMGYDKFIVYDNESTDNTVELLKQYPFVEVRTYKTNGSFNLGNQITLKNVNSNVDRDYGPYERKSLSEIAEELNVTRSAVHDTLKKASVMLEMYESKLGLLAKEKEKMLLLEKIDTLSIEEIKNIVEKL